MNVEHSLPPRPEGDNDGDERAEEDEAGDDDDSDLGLAHGVLDLQPYPGGGFRDGDELHVTHPEQGADGRRVLLHSPGDSDITTAVSGKMAATVIILIMGT